MPVEKLCLFLQNTGSVVAWTAVAAEFPGRSLIRWAKTKRKAKQGVEEGSGRGRGAGAGRRRRDPRAQPGRDVRQGAAAGPAVGGHREDRTGGRGDGRVRKLLAGRRSAVRRAGAAGGFRLRHGGHVVGQGGLCRQSLPRAADGRSPAAHSLIGGRGPARCDTASTADGFFRWR